MAFGSIWKRTVARRIADPFAIGYCVAFVLLYAVEGRELVPKQVTDFSFIALIVSTYLAYRLGPVWRFRQRITEENFCMYCGYSLKGNHRDGVCPECGTSIAESLRILEEHRSIKWYQFVFL